MLGVPDNLPEGGLPQAGEKSVFRSSHEAFHTVVQKLVRNISDKFLARSRIDPEFLV